LEYSREKEKGGRTEINAQRPENKHALPSLTIDYEKYAHFLEEADLTENQKREFLQTIHDIILSFIDLGFGVHPLQQACGQGGDNSSKAASSILSVLRYPDKLLFENFEDAAEREAELQGEGAE